MTSPPPQPPPPPHPLPPPSSVAAARVGPGPADQLGQLQPRAVDELPRPCRTDAVPRGDLDVGEAERVHYEHRPLARVDLAQSLEHLLERDPVAGRIGLVGDLRQLHVSTGGAPGSFGAVESPRLP